MWSFPDDFFDGRPTLAEMIGYNRHTGILRSSRRPMGTTMSRGRVAAVRAGAIPPFEWTRADGKVLQYQCIALPNGGRMLTYFDITEMKQREEELSAVLDTIEYGICFMGPDLRARVANRAFRDMWSFAGDFFDGHPTLAEMIGYNRHTRDLRRSRRPMGRLCPGPRRGRPCGRHTDRRMDPRQRQGPAVPVHRAAERRPHADLLRHHRDEAARAAAQ